jgi:uncharacterized protein YdhG (YjbR/CyaY superfamily)
VIDALAVLIGEWGTESKKLGGRGRATVEKFEGDRFVRLRSSEDNAKFPTSTWIIGSDDSTHDCTCVQEDRMIVAKNEAVDAYIEAAPNAARPHLRALRKTILTAAPKAQEKMSYGMPFYEYRGRLVYFAAFKKHVGVYAVGKAKGLEKYFYGASTLRFPFGEPLPAALIAKLVKARVKENEAKA